MWGVTSTCWLTDWVTLSRFHLHQSSWTGQSELRNVQCFYSSNCDTCIDQPLTRPSTSQPRPRWDEDALLVLTLRTASTNPRNFNDLLPTLYCLWDLRKMQTSDLFFNLPLQLWFLVRRTCCHTYNNGDDDEDGYQSLVDVFHVAPVRQPEVLAFSSSLRSPELVRKLTASRHL